MSAKNEALIRRAWDEMINGNNLDLLPEIYAADAAYHGPDGDLNGVEELRAMITGYLTAFPDVQATIDDLVTSGDQVVVRATVRGTNTGPLGDIPPSGESIEMTIMQFLRIEDGRIVEEWEQFNLLAMLQQIGAIPAEVGA